MRDVMLYQYEQYQKMLSQRITVIQTALNTWLKQHLLDQLHEWIILGFEPGPSLLSICVDWE